MLSGNHYFFFNSPSNEKARENRGIMETKVKEKYEFK